MKFAIATMLKNEQDSLIEWVSHYLSEGFQHFFIANNESDDDSENILKELHKVGLVTYINYNDQPGVRPQVGAFNALLKTAAESGFDVLGFLDLDEFLVSSISKKSSSQILNELFIDQSVNGVAVNWLNFGSSGNIFKDEGLVLERFTKCAHHDWHNNHHYKSFCRLSKSLEMLGPHHVKLQDGRYIYSDRTDLELLDNEVVGISDRVVLSPLRINHYVVKSVQEFVQIKMRRGNASTNRSTDKKSYFLGYDQNFSKSFLGSFSADKTISEMKKLLLKCPSLKPYAPVPFCRELSTAHFFYHFDMEILDTISAFDAINGLNVRGWCVSTRFGAPSVVLKVDDVLQIFETTISRQDVVSHIFGSDMSYLENNLFGFSVSVKFQRYIEIGFRFEGKDLFVKKIFVEN